jgi:ribose transport system permease protein
LTAKPELKEAIRSAPVRRVNDSGIGAIELIQDLGLFIVIGFGAIALGILSPVFFTRLNIENLLFSSTVIAVIAIGESFVIMVAGIDLSVGAVLALSSVLSVGLVNDFGVPVALAIAVSLGVGALIGLINGLNVTLTKIPALIATLAMLTVTRGLAFIYSGGQNIAPVPDFYVHVQATRVFGIPVIILFTLALGMVAHFVLTKTRFGRSIYATGGNPVAARLSGIRVNRIIVLAYTISGVLAALGGLMITARLEAGAATAGQGTELTVISAVVIGGVSLFGGEGKIAGVLLGVLLLGLVQNAINLLNVPPNYDYVVSGLVIAVAAALDVYRRNYLEAGLRRRENLPTHSEPRK